MTNRKRWLTVEETKEKLDSISPTYCGAKWTQVLYQLHLGKLHNCCLTPAQEINKSAFFDSEKLKKEREDFLAGKKIDDCSACWKAEDKGFLSDRISKSSDPSTFALYDSPDKFKTVGVIPTYIELSLSNRCQFKCAYCSPENSSALYSESLKYGSYMGIEDFGSSKHLYRGDNYFLENEANPYVDAFLEWFPKISRYVKVLRFTGGEPLLSNKLYDVLDTLIKNPSSDLELVFNSNLGVPAKVLDEFLSHLKTLPKESYKEISFVTSLDGWGEGAKLARWGLELDLFERNFLKIREELPESKVVFTGTLNILALPDLKKLMVKMLEWKKSQLHADQILFTPYPLHYPAFLSPAWCMDHFEEDKNEVLQFVNEHFIGESSDQSGFKSVEKDFLEKAFGKDILKNHDENLFNFTLFMIQHQKRKGWDNSALAPKILNLLNSGKEYCREVFNEKKRDTITLIKLHHCLDISEKVMKDILKEKLPGMEDSEYIEIVDYMCKNIEVFNDEWVFWWFEQKYPGAIIRFVNAMSPERKQNFWSMFVKRVEERGEEYWLKLASDKYLAKYIPMKVLKTLRIFCSHPMTQGQLAFWALFDLSQKDN